MSAVITRSATAGAAALRPMTASLANNIATALAGQRKDAAAEAMLREEPRLGSNLTLGRPTGRQA